MSKFLTTKQIEQHVLDIGSTGGTKIKDGGLYTQREENCDWLFCGAVEDEEEARAVIQSIVWD